ncbi:hypothetical protein [Arthrobacter sp. H16F315]|uniref:hypothetical protein n=1 Tax=Arthrobacter sp. H16F315 TaxID=2955314 RepID=UPI002096A3B9|nr:hypothetical protein [Arthrobacter sp. H16F315]MDD1475848.1 hypothetical protein [Arthrobacter sp. H16F315]
MNLERVQLGIGPRAIDAEPYRALPGAAAVREPADITGPRLEGLAEAKAQIQLATQLRSAMADAGHGSQDSPGKSDTVTGARRLLARAAAYLGPRAELNARILLAAALEQAGNRKEAESTLWPALETCSRLSLVRPVLDGGPSCLELVRATSARLRREPAPEVGSPELPRFLSILIRLEAQARTNRDAGWSAEPVPPPARAPLFRNRACHNANR